MSRSCHNKPALSHQATNPAGTAETLHMWINYCEPKLLTVTEESGTHSHGWCAAMCDLNYEPNPLWLSRTQRFILGKRTAVSVSVFVCPACQPFKIHMIKPGWAGIATKSGSVRGKSLCKSMQDWDLVIMGQFQYSLKHLIDLIEVNGLDVYCMIKFDRELHIYKITQLLYNFDCIVQLQILFQSQGLSSCRNILSDYRAE